MAELGEADEAELQRLVAAEQQKAQFTAQVRGRGGNRLGPLAHENWFSPAVVDRFIDTHFLPSTSRFKGGQ
uniref:Uncharacterized protein n=1 Tax=Rhinopithecus bieti TaxID=61621 RepID=A0A2K6MYL9_RHIBE